MELIFTSATEQAKAIREDVALAVAATIEEDSGGYQRPASKR
jgi:hypothetical protein